MKVDPNTLAFIKRWQEKRSGYNLNNLEDCFDSFFTSFVLYNFLYQEITSQMNLNLTRDEDMAAKAAKKFLGAQQIFDDTTLRKNTDELIKLIENKTFYIREGTWDQERITKLKSTNPDEWAKGLLEIIYAIRCNLFHGRKNFEKNQMAILIPCICALERVNNMIVQKINS